MPARTRLSDLLLLMTKYTTMLRETPPVRSEGRIATFLLLCRVKAAVQPGNPLSTRHQMPVLERGVEYYCKAFIDYSRFPGGSVFSPE